MLSFNSDKEFFTWLVNTEFREGQFSEGELLYMLKRFREEYRKVEGTNRSLNNDIFNFQKAQEVNDANITTLNEQINFLNCKNKVLLDKFSKGLTLKERLTGKVSYHRDSKRSND